MKPPIKIMVWGPGKLGRIAIWEILQNPAFELVAVGAYSDAKNAVDVGTLLGLDEIGLRASTERDALMTVETDCVIYTAHDRGTYHTDDEILKLLNAGHNVVTPLPYQNAHLFREAAFTEKLKQACRTGQSVFHATGIDPDVVSDRVLMALTGLCTDIKSVSMQEYWNCGASAPESLRRVGFGDLPDEARAKSLPATIAANFLRSIGRTAEHMLGQPFDELRLVHDYLPAPHDLETDLPVKAGQVARIAHRVEGYIAAKGPHPFYSVEYNWLLDDIMLPVAVAPGQYYKIAIEGRPSVSVSIDLKTSLEGDARFYEIGSMKSEPSYHATIAPCLQAVAYVCEAPAGILPSFGPGLHWRHDCGRAD
jgi:2,4-diaminopentanoate dehydrogenase